MKRSLLYSILLLLPMFSFSQEIKFEDYFRYKTLRIDFDLGGGYGSETFFLAGLKQEPFWGGPMKNLVDPFNYGTYRIAVVDSSTGKTIYTKGYSNLFQEYQGTPEAKILKRTFREVATVPYPKNTIQLRFERRDNNTNLFNELFSMYVNPETTYINKESPHFYPSVKFKDAGNPIQKVDIAFLAEGYTKDQMDKFRNDAKRMADELLNMKPYSDYKDRFNFYAVETVSEEPGTDIPGEDIYVSTAFNSSFYTFYSDRYLTTSDLSLIHDAAANVPYDAIIILVNHKRYGGGGFYNLYAMGTVDNATSPQVIIHEFGHSFAGLADEYVGGTNSDGMYSMSVEPWEPNITTNVDFGSKWKAMIDKDTPVPTPRTKEYESKVGLFEGGGYMAKGIYSPMMDCRMKTNEASGFCAACKEAIIKMIDFYSE